MPRRAPYTRVRASAPATLANLGAGFDTLGVALTGPGDSVTAERVARRGVELVLAHPVDGLPARGASNVATVVARRLLNAGHARFGVRLTLAKGLPIGSGLGSSAASGVAALVAVNELLDAPLPRAALLAFAVAGEAHASGAAHADNVAPALFGGACLVRGAGADGVLRLGDGAGLVWAVVHPHLRLDTAVARRALPRTVPLATAVRQWANVGALVAGLVGGEPALVGAGTEDVVVEPARARLIPGFDGVRRAAMRAGALGCSIAGAGPSVFAVTDDLAVGARVIETMRRAFARAGLDSDARLALTDPRGARVVSRSRA
jgi:homoserine kinase